MRPLVLLDLDGTLIDSAPGIMSSLRHAFADLALPVPDDATLRTFVGPPIHDSMRAHGVPEDRVEDVVRRYREVFAAGGMYDARVYEGIPDALAILRGAGRSLLVATSKPHVYAVPLVRHFGLEGLVDGVFGAPLDESGTKATVIAEALASCGSVGDAFDPARAVMVGDREHDVHGAAAHGIRCVGAAWGYAPSGELEEAGAVTVAGTPTELPTVVAALLRGV
ncbi:HAD hydrolase-like protein [Cellulomonas sp. HZM]|uniref:HAD hydrolase-like protein n=1 Tax=Cellulomonas sp. HZM TaxID=1454010 RepID=UPI00054FE7B6|nr:HAD hydrolase-like protein [Cellulomonas sp. HZM]